MLGSLCRSPSAGYGEGGESSVGGLPSYAAESSNHRSHGMRAQPQEVPLVLLPVAVVAAWIPARRASAVDTMAILGAE